MPTKIFKRKDVLWRCHIKEVNPEGPNGEITWSAIISGSEPDRDRQWVNQKTLADQWQGGYKDNPLVVYMHGWKSPIGNIREYALIDENLSMADIYIGKDFSVPVELGFSGVVINVNDLRRQVDQKILRSFSIAFDADEVHEEGAKFQRLDVTDWYETSLVTIPSYRRAQIQHQANAEATQMLARFLGDQRIKDFYLGLDDVGADEDPVLMDALRLLSERTRLPEKDFSEADIARLASISNT